MGTFMAVLIVAVVLVLAVSAMRGPAAGMLLDSLTVAGALALVLSLTARGLMSEPAAVGVLLGVVWLVALARAARMGPARLAFRFGLPVAALAGLVATYGGGDPREEAEVLTGILALWVVLFGFYIMFRGLFGGDGRRR